jgi:peptidoglycan/xylan/chitin deacetylase (PgdA/CDA1 family)
MKLIYNRNLLSIILVLVISNFIFSQSIAFTFDDGPKVEVGSPLSPSERNTLLLQQLKDNGIKSALFLTLKNLHDSGFVLVRKWGEERHMIGNHTVTHPFFGNSKVTLKNFEQELLGCDSVIRNMPGYTKLFRFPFLNEGDTKAKRDGFRLFMKSIGYKPAPVSVDASDWYYNSRLLTKLKENPEYNVEPYRKAYLNHLWNRACYYDSLSKQVLGRSVKHILLLHHNTINAMFLGDIINMFNKKGWKVIDAETAFKDPVYKMEPKILPAGQSIIWGLAKEKKFKGLRYPGEDDTYEKPILDAFGL